MSNNKKEEGEREKKVQIDGGGSVSQLTLRTREMTGRKNETSGKPKPGNSGRTSTSSNTPSGGIRKRASEKKDTTGGGSRRKKRDKRNKSK